MERPIFKPIGTPAIELDTPALVVDIHNLENNINKMASFFAKSNAKLRPHVAAHGSPAIAHKQLDAGGTLGGISTATVGQAEVFTSYGFKDIFICNLVVTGEKARRLCAIAKRATVTVAVDSPLGVTMLSEAAVANHVILKVVLYLKTAYSEMGVSPGNDAVELSKKVQESDGLDFKGLMAYEGPILSENYESLVETSRETTQPVLDTREDIENAGLDVEVVSIGGTHNYEIVGNTDGVTEVPAGSYALMDERYRLHRSEFSTAAHVLTCVTSMPAPGNIITDGGRKTMGGDDSDPGIVGLEGASVRGLSAEHFGIDVDPDLQHGLKLADRVWAVPGDIASCVNVHDYMFVIQDDKLEAIWDLPARGQFR